MAAPLLYPRLAALLAERDLSHRDIAVPAGVTTHAITLIVRGRMRPSADLKERIAAVLGVPVDEVFAISPAVLEVMALARERGLGDDEVSWLTAIEATAAADTQAPG